MIRQLWAIEGPQWRMPVWVELQGSMALMDYACPITGEEHMRVKHLVETRSAYWKGNVWNIPLSAMQTCAKPWPSAIEDPAIIKDMDQEPPAQAPPPSPALRLPLEQEKFLRAYFEIYGLTVTGGYQGTMNDMYHLWHSLLTFSQQWLINYNRPLDLGFITLTPVPYRANWKNAALAQHPYWPGMIKMKSDAQKEILMHSCGLAEFLQDPVNMAWNTQTGTIYWSLELHYTPRWWKNISRREARFLETLGAEGYAKRINDIMEKHVVRHAKMFKEWLAQASRPCAEYSPGSSVRRSVLLPYIPDGRMRPIPPSDGVIPSVVGNKRPMGWARTKAHLA